MGEAQSSGRRAAVYQQDRLAGFLEEQANGGWSFTYGGQYSGPPVSLTMPVQAEAYLFRGFPPVFEGLLPEGWQLEALLRRKKIDRDNFFAQLIAVGRDLVGSISVRDATEEP
jgi:serine/threonine-protein kinase HipA